jgi:hypothetical protein
LRSRCSSDKSKSMFFTLSDYQNSFVMPGLVPRLSGSFFVDKAHGVDSSVLKRLATF